MICLTTFLSSLMHIFQDINHLDESKSP
jgi:hypothetical protein